MIDNMILAVDSYKSSHYLGYPPGTTGMFSYLESRGGTFGKVVFFGLQFLLRRYLSRPVTAENVDEAGEFFRAHGEPFNHDGWMHVVEEGGGFPPLPFRAR